MSTATREAEMLKACGSPIEQSLLRALLAEAHRLGWFVCVMWPCGCEDNEQDDFGSCAHCAYGLRGYTTHPKRALAPGEVSIGIHLQWEIGAHRVDFRMEASCEPAEDGACWTTSMHVIECDGHEAHSTREQRTADAQRDRYLLEQGYRVMRFTGSEIWRNHAQCASEALRILQTRPHRYPGKPVQPRGDEL